MSLPITAIMYDFDKTLSPKDMQEYAFIPEVGLSTKEFWAHCDKLTETHGMDPILSYMLCMVKEAEGKMLITRNEFKKCGEQVELFDGVEDWFDRINEYGKKIGTQVEHYIISSGLKEIIEGTKIAKHFKEIYAAEFCYNDRNVPFWPSMAVNYTSKTQFVFRVNKGILDKTDHKSLNTYTPDELRRVPFSNMIYIGDGLTDVPCMKLVKTSGGHSIAAYGEGKESLAKEMLEQGRVNFTAKADYTKGSRMEEIVCSVMDKIVAENKVVQLELQEKR